MTAQMELTLEIARELELAEANAAVRCAEAMKSAQNDSIAACEAIAGGCAVYCGPENPITQAVGLGLARPTGRQAEERLPTGLEIRAAQSAELDLWVLAVAQGFAENRPVTLEILNVMKMFAEGRNTECYFAIVDGRIAGAATLALRGRIAGLFGAIVERPYEGDSSAGN